MKRPNYEVLLLLLLAVSQYTYADKYKIVCVYESQPVDKEAIVNEVLAGIKSKTGDIQTIPFPESTESLRLQITQANPDKIIALGRSAAETVVGLGNRDKAIAGLFFFNASSFNGVSLTISGKSIAAKLAKFFPDIKRIFIVQERGFKTIETTKDLNIPGLSILAIDGHDSLSTIRELGRIMENGATLTDAVIIPPNLPDDILFNVGLTAWEKKIKLFSTNMKHLENGVLMVFYPNPMALGEQIGEMANKNNKAFETSAKIDTGLNRRIAQHLDIQFPPTVEAMFSAKIK